MPCSGTSTSITTSSRFRQERVVSTIPARPPSVSRRPTDRDRATHAAGGGDRGPRRRRENPLERAREHSAGGLAPERRSLVLAGSRRGTRALCRVAWRADQAGPPGERMGPARHRAGRPAAAGARHCEAEPARAARRRCEGAGALLARRLDARRSLHGASGPGLLRNLRGRHAGRRGLRAGPRRISGRSARGRDRRGVLRGRPMGAGAKRRDAGTLLVVPTSAGQPIALDLGGASLVGAAFLPGPEPRLLATIGESADRGEVAIVTSKGVRKLGISPGFTDLAVAVSPEGDAFAYRTGAREIAICQFEKPGCRKSPLASGRGTDPVERRRPISLSPPLRNRPDSLPCLAVRDRDRRRGRLADARPGGSDRFHRHLQLFLSRDGRGYAFDAQGSSTRASSWSRGCVDSQDDGRVRDSSRRDLGFPLSLRERARVRAPVMPPSLSACAWSAPCGRTGGRLARMRALTSRLTPRKHSAPVPMACRWSIGCVVEDP